MKRAFMSLFLIVLAACTSTPAATPPAAPISPSEAATPSVFITASTIPTEPLLPTGTPAPAPAAYPSACVPHNKQVKAKVIRVIDGDTIQVQIGGKKYKLRYIGMDTPEINPEAEPYGKQAAAMNKALVGGKTVTLIKDVSEVDQYGRLLRYVFVGDTFVNYALVYDGYASQATFPPDVACAQTFAAAEQSAREQGRGMWKEQ